ncbi:conserved Plasmodium protein, unknown function [Plasmodium relictum]|uniref:Uncharacterized protein n=1 Tax=Plasmodium relictum TaxID=85471 RepID=A0A1J1H4V3_PLARL|nr:conserved Plasmodium protein, unknown function [Plasmodium relictum]CRG98624.1 conserved Plasmodium protein, unknown function [Plasmodium relictum]
MFGNDLKVSTNIYDYQNNYKNCSGLKSGKVIVNDENDIENKKELNEKLSESKSLSPQISNYSDIFKKNTTYIKNKNSIDLFSMQTKLNNKNNKLKKMFSGLGNQMKNAINVFDEVKEQIKYTAKEAKKNINYPFCKAPCNIENLKNTIYINEEEIVINKNIYNTIFKKKKKDEKENIKKNENEDIFTCSSSDIIIRGNYNFGFEVEVKYENEENKIIVHAFDKDTKKKIPCSYKWKKIYSFQHCSMIQRNLLPKKNNIYDNEYELTCEDIGIKIYVECSCINSEQATVENISKFSINSSVNSENGNNYNRSSIKNTIQNNKIYNSNYEEEISKDFNSEKNSFNLDDCNKSFSMSNSLFQLSSNKRNMKTDENKVNYKNNNVTEIFNSYENSVFNKNSMNTISNNKYYGVAIAEIGPFNLNMKTKKMLETIIHNDTIRYPIYIIKKVNSNEDKNNEDIMSNISRKKNLFSDYDDNNSIDNLSLYSNMESENDVIYMLHIHKNEIKIIDQNNKTKHMWSYKFNHIYPFIEFLENKYYFSLHINSNEYYVCKCLYKRHRDLIAIILRYMHANLYIINDYIFNNINQNFERTRVKNIFDNVDVNTVLENINKELLISQKLNQKYMFKINSLKSEKNILEDDLKNTIEAFQTQLDNVKKFKDENELLKANDKLMKEIKILQDKYRNVDLFFKNKYKALLNDIEKYKKLVEENKSKINSENVKELYAKIEIIEKEKNELLNQNIEINNLYNEEKTKKLELEKKLESLNTKLEYLNKSLQEEKTKGNENSEYIKQMEELKTNNLYLQQKNVKYSDEINLLITEKNRLTKLVDSLTRDIEKWKLNGSLRNLHNPMDIEHDNHKLLKEVISLRDENDLLKKRIKKFANITTT